MFTTFIATFSIPRDKIKIIKFLRMVAGPNHPMGTSLKTAKDAVEEMVCFDSYMDDYVSIKVELSEAGVGRLAYYQMQSAHDCAIIDIVGIDPPPIKPDFSLLPK